MQKTERRPLSKGEEIANSLSHGLGLFAALLGTPILITTAIQHGSGLKLVGVCVFIASVMLLYLASTLYHACWHADLKMRLRKVDHSAIFVLIAGTYTPFTLGPLRGPWGWGILILVWAIAIFGVLLTVFSKVRRVRLSIALYLGMGWLIVAAIRPLMQHLPVAGLKWLVAGGLAYTVGVIFYSANGYRYTHSLWHLFVLAGTGCHYFAVLWYAV